MPVRFSRHSPAILQLISPLSFDEDRRAHVTGLRPGGERVAVSGTSTGTADQLYLALRVASVEAPSKRTSPLPFVADDLFIDFDDARAASSLEVMGQVTEKTQVLLFTHHSHLVDIARAKLGPSSPSSRCSDSTDQT